jgi:hypothetical protein
MDNVQRRWYKIQKEPYLSVPYFYNVILSSINFLINLATTVSALHQWLAGFTIEWRLSRRETHSTNKIWFCEIF